MESAFWKKGIITALLESGFRRSGQLIVFDGPTVCVLVGFQKYGSQSFINVGFWIKELSATVPARIEHTHLYFRLERLFPDLLTTIRTAGCFDAPDCGEYYADLLDAIQSSIGPRLAGMGNISELRKEYAGGLQRRGLVSKEVVPLLERE